ncbi:MAG: hypothetical protein WCT14_19555 [Treponemataceae bacterium]
MRTTLKIETGTENLEVELKIVDGKQIVELELAQLLALVGGKKTPAKVAKVAKAPKSAKKTKAAATEVSAPVIAASESKTAGAKRGRKPKTASSGVSPFGSKDN